ncbi:MAG TPA: SHOCT domain-containing protein [Ignavibacteria bacterium]|nr:SHOCT domain-containing protein [Ignavibacteria bacterium]
MMITESINGKTYNFYSITGTVVGSTKNSRTHVYGGGGGQHGSNYVSSYNTVHDYIFIKDPNGKEHEIHMKNWDIGTRDGHEVLFIWTIQNGQNTGPYLCVKNLSTGMVYTDKNEIKNMSRYSYGFINLWVTLPMTGLFFLFWVYYTFILSQKNAWWKKDSSGISMCCFAIVLVVFAIGLSISSSIHKNEFKNKEYKKVDVILKKMININDDIESKQNSVPDRNDPMKEIEKLFQMKEKGIISEEDFKTMKEKIIKEN